ncbi:hypothetical protein [Paramaledivibacter caminithermalis]|uniref:hypothetical protein n=1 Tax=Paramaledivibacter caminithermalis TaxID=191027 RepID=UPI0013F4DE90|nr:hypothetical protein [Paramaledivibacter caminithermalis]
MCFATEKSSLDEKYGLKTITEEQLPEGIEPIEFKSQEELEQFLQRINNTDSIDLGTTIIDKNGFVISSIRNSLANKSGTEDTFEWDKTKKHGLLTQHLNARVTVYAHGSFGQIQKVKKVHTYATGYSGGINYVPDPNACGSDISSDKQSAKIYGAGDIEYYLIISGGLKLTTKRAKISGTYKIR